ncbi:hypothetical protein D1159_07305 [Pseudoflavonifractor sp. 524-17]|nr:hypothetical protein [Pseudoflavonifractor sp. 524-17]
MGVGVGSGVGVAVGVAVGGTLVGAAPPPPQAARVTARPSPRNSAGTFFILNSLLKNHSQNPNCRNSNRPPGLDRIRKTPDRCPADNPQTSNHCCRRQSRPRNPSCRNSNRPPGLDRIHKIPDRCPLSNPQRSSRCHRGCCRRSRKRRRDWKYWKASAPRVRWRCPARRQPKTGTAEQTPKAPGISSYQINLRVIIK